MGMVVRISLSGLHSWILRMRLVMFKGGSTYRRSHGWSCEYDWVNLVCIVYVCM